MMMTMLSSRMTRFVFVRASQQQFLLLSSSSSSPASSRLLPIHSVSCTSSVLQRCSMSSKAGRGGNNNNNHNNNSNSNSNKKPSASPQPRRQPGKTYQSRHQPKPLKRIHPPKGPKEPNDITRRVPKIDLSKITVTDADDDDDDDENSNLNDDFDVDDWSEFGPHIQTAIQKLRHDGGAELDIETHLKMMDYFTSAPGSTEDMVGERRALSLESWDGKPTQEVLEEINRLVEKERLDYLELPATDLPTKEELERATTSGSRQIPSNQLAHGPWGEMLIRTDRVCKMWRGGRIESYRALVIGGNLRGCGGFGVGKAFEPEDAVEIASRMARRNIFFVDRYRNRTLAQSLVGRQNSCKVILRTTNNGLRGNPLCCEILKLFGITNVVAKAHGNRNHQNVVRATFKALQTHESLDEIAFKRGLRLVNLQKAKRLGI